MAEQCQRQINVPTNAIPAEFARKLERERDGWKAKYIKQNKDLGCEMMDPNGTIWDYAKKLDRERDETRKQRDKLAEALRELRDAEWLTLPGRANDIVESALATLNQR